MSRITIFPALFVMFLAFFATTCEDTTVGEVGPSPDEGDPTDTVALCDPTVPFYSTGDALREVHIAVTGVDESGTAGTQADPFATLGYAMREDRLRNGGSVPPGTAYRIHQGTYPDTSVYAEGLRGYRNTPISITGVEGEARPILQGGGENAILFLSRAEYIVLRGFGLANNTSHGINLDDGALYDASVSHHVIVEDVTFSSISGTCLKFAGVDEVVVYNSRFAACGTPVGGSSITFVGCHEGLVAASTFEASDAPSAVELFNGSAAIDIVGNSFLDAGHRAITLGTAGDGIVFRRPRPSECGELTEVSDIRIYSNIIDGGIIGLAGCVKCLIAHNNFTSHIAKNVQLLPHPDDTDCYTFLPSTDVEFTNNIFYLDDPLFETMVSIADPASADLDTFEFVTNLWYNGYNPDYSQPAEVPIDSADGNLFGVDPQFQESPTGVLAPDSPAIGAGTPVTGVYYDFNFSCFERGPRDIGAIDYRGR